MERRRTDRKALLQHTLAAMWYFFAHSGRPITGKWDSDSTPQLRCQIRIKFSGTFEPLNCANPVNPFPLFVTRPVISAHDVFFGILSAAVDRKARGVLRYLERAESREVDVWYSQDYRLAQVVLLLSDEGQANAYSKAFFQLFGKNAHQVRFWWRDREKLYRLCEMGGSNTPLLHSNLIGDLAAPAVIPDFDYSQVSPVLPPRAAHDHPAKIPDLGTRARTGAGTLSSPKKTRRTA